MDNSTVEKGIVEGPDDPDPLVFKDRIFSMPIKTHKTLNPANPPDEDLQQHLMHQRLILRLQVLQLRLTDF